MSASVLIHAQITTTTAKAKSLRPYLERLITKAIQANNAATESARIATMRVIDSRLGSKDALDLLMNVTARIMADRPGGYTRILKAGIRAGDAAEMSVIELVSSGSLLDSVLPAEFREKTVSDKERYDYLKGYCLQRSRPVRSVISDWINYPFPKIPATMKEASDKSIVTTIQIPSSDQWSDSKWPRRQGAYVPLELVVRFYLDSEDYGRSSVSVQQARASADIRLFPASGDATSIALLVLPPAPPREWETAFAEFQVSLEHVFEKGRPDRLSAAIFGPYEQLRAIRWVAKSPSNLEIQRGEN